MATSLNRTYGVTLPQTFKRWTGFLEFTSDLDWWATFDLNPRCVFGGYQNELFATAFAPICLVAAVFLLSTLGHCSVALWRLRLELAADGRRRFSSMVRRRSSAAEGSGAVLRSSVAVQTGASQACHSLQSALAHGLLRPLPFCLFVVFIFLPSVSTAIFQVQACCGFWYNDGDGARGAGSAKHYFMRPQTDVRCAPSTSDHRALQQTITLTLTLFLTLTLTLSLALILTLSLALILTLTLALILTLTLP